MTRSRFEILDVEQHGRPVVVIFDNATGETKRVYQRGSRWLNWKDDTRVEVKGLRDCAKAALA